MLHYRNCFHINMWSTWFPACACCLPPPPPPPPTPQIQAAMVNLMSVFNAATTKNDELSIQEYNIITYIGGYIWRRRKPKLCSGCQSAISSHLNVDGPSQSFHVAKKYPSDKTGLLAPSSMLGELLQNMQVDYRRMIDSCVSKPGVKSGLNKCLAKVSGLAVHCGVCHLKESVTHLFVNIRLHPPVRQTKNWKMNRTIKTEKHWSSVTCKL